MDVTPDIFVITSVINTGNRAWSYTSIRSVYTPQERFEQTLQTIKSIRDYTSNSKILLVECSELSAEMTHELKSRVDIFEQLYHNEEIRSICLQTSKKGYGEATQTAAAIRIIKDSGLNFRRIFKISGRYWLKDSFCPEAFSEELFTFKAPHPGIASYSTVLYSVPKCLFNKYENIINECCNIYKIRSEAYGWECLFPPKCNPKALVSLLNVAGMIAVSSGEYFEG